MDIVAYSELATDKQTGLLAQLQSIVSATPEFARAKQSGQLISLSTGDGMALVFFGDPEAPVRCALRLGQAFRNHGEIKVRMGVHSGPVYRVADINANLNVAGGGINVAQRVMNCGEAGHILVSSAAAEVLRELSDWGGLLHDLGEAKVKHDLRVHLFNLYSSEAGNPARPRQLRRRESLRRYWLAAALAAAVMLAVLAGLYVQRMRTAQQAERPRIESLAVLPLENLSGDPNQEYFADGMTEELITDLAKIRALRVISRTSVMRFKNTKTPLPQIARELGVDGIVAGSVQRSGGRVHISAQLIRAATDTNVWANSYERDAEDVLALESEVAAAVADQIRITISREERARLASTRRVDPKAYDAYLKGRNYAYSALTLETLRQGIDSLQHSVALDNTYAPAHAALSYSYQLLAFNGFEAPANVMPKARMAALDALRLDDTLGEAHASLYLVKYVYDLDWAGAEAELKQALELDSNSPVPHQRRGEYLTCNLQQFEEAYREFRLALELDPNSVFVAQELAWNRQMARRWDEAVRDLQRALVLSPDEAPVHGFLAVTFAHLNRRAEALAEINRRLALMPEGKEFAFDYNLIDVYATLGMKKEARTVLEHWLNEIALGRYVDAYIVAESYGVLGEKELTLRWLEKAYENRSPQIVFIKIDWALDGIRSDARFRELVRRLNL
jgi:TolB-like protein/class 3 adenylate cyclase